MQSCHFVLVYCLLFMVVRALLRLTAIQIVARLAEGNVVHALLLLLRGQALSSSALYHSK